ncbi:MAG: hypothetical protein KDA05_11685, partial [Phycisphaerales bacterium]|nr:hypothetical protein [Phycisphaerales bacterium]
MQTRHTLALALCCGSASIAAAQPISWAAGSGPWGNASNWNPVNVPDNAGEDAILGGGSAYTVSLATAPAISPTIGSLMITNPLAALSIEGGRTLTLNAASSSNHGLIQLNPNGAGSAALLSVAAPVTLGGTGQVQMVAGGGFSQINATAGATLTNGPGHTIRGVGNINATLLNQGTIRADSSISLTGTTLLLQTGMKANNASIEAAGGSTLAISGITLDQTGGGALLADGGDISLRSAAVLGGSINATGTGLLEITTGTCRLDSVTLNIPTDIVGGRNLVISGPGLPNNNILRINPNLGGVGTILRFDNSGVLGGTGQVQMVAGGVFSQLNTAAGATITHDAPHTIRGVGQVNAGLINNSTITADGQPGVPLQLRVEDKTNNAVLEAAPDSDLWIDSITIDQTGGGSINATGAGSLISLRSATILGGSINATGTGLLEITTGTCRLDSVTLNTPTDIVGGRNLVISGPGLPNNDLLRINPNLGGTGTILRFDN